MIRYLYWFLSLAWMGFIFWLSSKSTVGIGQTKTERFLILKTFHLIEYVVLYILLFLSWKDSQKGMISAYIYAMSDEIHQAFVPGREGKFVDTLIDLLGITIGLTIIKLYLRFDRLRQSP